MKRMSIYATASVAAALALTACGSSGSSAKNTGPGATGANNSTASAAAGPGSLIIGSADFAENKLLADIYADAFSAKGVKITKKLGIGERAVYLPALQDGSIDFVPEYNGSILYFLDTTATAKSTDDVQTALKTAATAKGLSVLTPADAQDSDTLTVTKDAATKDNLKSIGDLAAVAGKSALGAPAGFQTRADGVPSLKSVYGVTFGSFVQLQAGGAATITALQKGTVLAADIFSTDPAIAANNLVSLTDDKNMFAAQNIVPLVKTSKLTSTITDAANAVSAKLDTATLAGLVAKVSNDNQDPDAVAKAWLTSAGLTS